MVDSLNTILKQLTLLELWIVIGSAVASALFERLLLPAVIVVLFFAALRVITGAGFSRTPADWGVIGLLIMIPITLWASALPEKTLPQVLRLLIGICLYYSVVNSIRTRVGLTKASSLVALLGISLAVLGLFNTIWILGKLPFFPQRIYASLPQLLADTIHPNVLAGSLVILLPLVVAIPLFDWQELNPVLRILFLFGSFFIILVLLLTQSRGAFFALGAAFAVMVSLRWRYGWIAFALLMVLTITLLTSSGVSSIIDAQDLSGDSAEKLEGRIEIWSRGLMMVSDFPFTGIGMGLYGDIADALYPFFINAPGSVPHAHNLFLQVAVDLGIPGLISWLSILITFLAASWWLFRRSIRAGELWMTGFSAGMLCSQIALAVHGMTDSVTWGMVKPAPLVWGIWGLAIAAWVWNDRADKNTLPQ